MNADVTLSGCSFKDGSGVVSDTLAITDTSALAVVGSQALDTGPNFLSVGGGINSLRVENNTGARRSSFVTTDGTTSGFAHVLPAGTNVVVSRNEFRDTFANGGSAGIVFVNFRPSDDANGGPLSVLAEQNEFRNHLSEGLEFRGVGEVGDNGSSAVVARYNLINGSSSSGVEIDTLNGGVGPHVGVGIDIQVHNNELVNGDSIPCDIDIGVSAGQTTRLVIRDNLLAIGESEAIEVTDEDTGAPAGANDGGIFDILCWRNTSLGGAEDIEFEVGLTHGGQTNLKVIENTVLSSEDEGFNIDLNGYLGTAGGLFAFPDGVYTFTMFNNDIEAHDDEAMEFRDNRDNGGDGSLGIAYVGHSFWHTGSDGSDGALTYQYRAKDGAALIENNFTGFGGADSTEAGIELNTGISDLRNQVRVQNCIATLASGSGITWDQGPWPQFMNNTSAYAGQQSSNGGREGFEFNGGAETGDSQAFILNCIASHSGNRDVGYIDGVRPFFTLVRDDSVPLGAGIGNVIGMEPAYATDLSDITGVLGADHALMQTLFQLQSTSPAVDAGHPAARYNDADGTRNDMGAYGGPSGGTVGTKSAGAPIPLAYVGTFPAVHLYTGALLPSNTGVLRFGFSEPVDAATVAAGVQITSGGAPIAGTFSTEAGGYLVVFTPSGALTGAVPFVDVSFTTSLVSTSGTPLAYAATERFAVRPAAPGVESEPNDDGVAGLTAADFAAAQGIPDAVFENNGTLSSAGDLDVYSVTAAAGARIMATILDERAGGGNDGRVRVDLYDAAGNVLTYGRENCFTSGLGGTGDSYLDHMVTTAGTYYIVVSNPDATGPLPYALMGVLD